MCYNIFMIYAMSLHPKYFEKIKDESKTIECRLFDEKRRILKIGDIIEFSSTSDHDNTVKTEIVELLKYPTFQDLIADFPAVSFGNENKSDVLDDLHKFYTLDQEKKYSVIGISVKLI